MLLLILIEAKTVVFHKCVETIYQPPKRFAHGEDIVQTTTRSRGYGDILNFK